MWFHRLLLLSTLCLGAWGKDLPLPLVYTEPDTLESDLTYRIALINPNASDRLVQFSITDASSALLGEGLTNLPAQGQAVVDLNALVSEGQVPQMAKVSIADESVYPILLVGDAAGERLAAVWPADRRESDTLLATHVATDRGTFFTGFAAKSDRVTPLTWQDGSRTIGTVAEGGVARWELGSLYGTETAPAVLHRITADRADSLLEGIQSFGTWDGTRRYALLPLAFTTNRRLVFPHIAADTANFWTGIVIGNPNGQTVAADIRFFATDGTLLQSQRIDIAADARQVILFDGVSDNAEGTPALPEALPDGVAWIDVASEDPLAGFELFGSPADFMEAVRASGSPWRSALLPYLHKEDQSWMGIALVNAVALPAQVTATLRDAGGQSVATHDVELAPHEKTVAILSGWFSAEDWERGASLSLESSGGEGLFGMTLFGDLGETRKTMAGYEPVPVEGVTPGATRGLAGLPRLGANFPTFNASGSVTVPGQDNLQREMMWWSAGHPNRIVTRQMQNRDVFFEAWDGSDATVTANRERWLDNDERFGVMPTLVGQHGVSWTGPESGEETPIDFTNEGEEAQMIAYVNEVVAAFPHLRYFEAFNEVMAEFGSASTPEPKRANFAAILRTIAETAKAANPDLTLSFPHLLGTIPEQVSGGTQALVDFSRDYADTAALYDVYGLHFYGPWQEFNDVLRASFIDAMDRGDLPRKPWVLSETGISNLDAPDTVTALNEIEGSAARQAAYVVKMPTMAYALGADIVLLHSVQSGSRSGNWAGYGLIGPNGERTLASCAFRFFAARTAHFTAVETLSETNPLWLYRYVDGAGEGQDVYICWSSDGASQRLTLNLPDLAGQTVSITQMVPMTCPGTAGDEAAFDRDAWFSARQAEVSGEGALSVDLGETPLLIQAE